MLFLDVLMNFLTYYLTNIPPYDRKPRGEVKTPLKQDFYLSVMKVYVPLRYTIDFIGSTG